MSGDQISRADEHSYATNGPIGAASAKYPSTRQALRKKTEKE
jgi:hypothetical protein